MKFTLDVRRRGWRRALRALSRRVKLRLGWRYCGCCRKFVKLRWVKDWIAHPEEPPLFIHWECPRCLARSPSLPTSLTTKAVRDLGYRNFDEYAKHVLKKKE
jgi:hypothetical protein